MTTPIKFLSFLSCFFLMLSCGAPTNTDQAKGSVQPDKTITISGKVQSIENGKDGYMAMVHTKTKGNYNSVVSIVNLGGPDNYQRFNIGDEVTLEGAPFMLGDEQQLKVEKIISVESTRTQLMIDNNAFRGITVGDKIADHTAYIQKEMLKTGEGDFEVYRIKDFNNNPAGYLMPDPRDESLVGDITVETQMAVTSEGIKIGGTFQDLANAIPNIAVNGSEIEGRTYATYDNIAYRLDAANFSYEVDKSKIPATTKIMEIVIKRH